jgi:hypothetical protein
MPKRDGEHIPGTAGKMSAQTIRDMLGLKPAPKPVSTPLSPAQARAKAEGKPIPPSGVEFEQTTIPAGRDAIELLGIDPADLPVGSEAGLAPPRKPPRERADAGALNAPSPEESAAAKAEELRQMAQEHVRRQAIRTKHAIDNGTPEQKAAAAEDAERSTALVRRIMDRIGGAG